MTKTKRLSIFNEIYLTAFTFCFLFAPPIIPGINLSIIFAIYSMVLTIIKYRKIAVSIFKNSSFRWVMSLIALYSIIYIISWSINLASGSDIYNNGIINLYSIFLNFFTTFTCSIYLVCKTTKLELPRYHILKYFIYAGLIQVVIALTAVVSSEFRSWTLEMMIKETNSNLLGSPWLLERRFYGFSNNLLDLFGFGTGILACLPLFYSTAEKKRLYLVYSPILLILPILNARSGIIIYMIGVIVWIASLLASGKIDKIKFFIYTPLIVLATISAFGVIASMNPETIEWVRDDLMSFSTGDKNSGTASVILSEDFWTLPQTTDMIIGSGHNISAYSSYRAENVSSYTDNGYINEIWKVGVIGITIYLYLIYLLVNTPRKMEKNVSYRYMYIFFVVASFVMLIKCSLMGYNPGNVMIYTMFVASCCSTKLEGKNR